MASKAFQKAAAAVDTTKNLETLIVGGPYLDDSTPHDVTIIGVDLAQLDEENKLQVVFANDKGVQHRDSIFVTAAPDSGEQWGFGFRWLLSGCLPDGKALKLFFETAAKDEKILEAFTGMKMRITLGLPPKGIRAHVLADGTFIGIDSSVIDPETNQPVVQTAVHAKLEDLWTEVKATNKKRAFLRITRIEATHKEENLAAFAAAVAALTQTPVTVPTPA